MTLHQLRHSAISHLAETETNLAVIRAKSRHRTYASLHVYANPGREAVAAATEAAFSGPTKGVRRRRSTGDEATSRSRVRYSASRA